MRGTSGQSGNSSGNGWTKSKDKFGVVTRETERSHWWKMA
jgi:hypothetical protein